MDKKVGVVITPNWGDYAKKYLADFVASLRTQDYGGEIKAYLADNETSPESFRFISQTAPEVQLILNNTNRGYAGGCNDGIRAAMRDGCEYVVVFNIHTFLESDCLRKMIEAAEKDPEIGAVQALMMLDPQRDLVSSSGNLTHFLGFGFCDGYKHSWKGGGQAKDIFYPSGSSFLVKREIIEKVGLFDEEFWMYNEDQDWGWRIWLAGWRCVLAPGAVMYNKYEFQRSIKKFYWMDRNRILAILKNYHFLTLILILPAFLLMELGHVLFSIRNGWFKDKMRVWKYFFSWSRWSYIIKARKDTQGLRKVQDRQIAKMIAGTIWYQEIDDWKLRLINPVFDIYWRLARFFIIW